LANPSQLISQPPPPLYPAAPTLYPPQPAATSSTSTSKTTPAPTVITNPQSFVVSMGAQPAYPQYSMYPPAVPYYQYPYTTPGAAYYAPAQQQPTVQPPAPQASSSPPTAQTANAVPGPDTTGNQGAWSDEETERLKTLAEKSKSGTTGEIDWDRVVSDWGNGRTRHQILIKATSLGLKESSTRGTKRRRETDGPNDQVSPAAPPNPAKTNSKTALASAGAASASPSQSHSTPTPVASPAMQHVQRPPSAKGQNAPAPPKPPTGNLPWPMPTVAVNTPSPVIAAPGTTSDHRTTYYRPRPPEPKPPSVSAPGRASEHQYMFQPNGSSDPRLAQETGS